MIPPFDVFLIESDGSPLWRGSAATLKDAEARVRELAAISPGQYIILNHQTGTRLVIAGHANVGGDSEAAV